MITNSGAANGTVHTVHDVFGNVIAELDAAGTTVREYIWLPEAEIAPSMGSRTVVDRPMAVVSGVNTTPTLLMVHVDHLHRPVKMTNAAGSSVWSAVWLPWGGAHTITGAETLDTRFPGQWFQLEAGLHYNWHRAYDPSLGRYTQPDPLGFVDGPGVYAYSRNSPIQGVDRDGRWMGIPPSIPNPSSDPSKCKPGDTPPPSPPGPSTPSNYDGCTGMNGFAGISGRCDAPEMGGGRGGGDGPDGPKRVPPKMEPPATPPGMTRNDMGKIWGKHPSETAHLTESLNTRTVQQWIDSGFTKQQATEWRNFYLNEAVRNESNLAASARVQFLDRFLGLAK